MLQKAVNHIQNLPLLRRKKTPKRKLFAFRCDPQLQKRIRLLAGTMGVHIAAASEHWLHLGLLHSSVQLQASGDAQRFFSELKQHIQESHMRTPCLSGESIEKRIIADNTELSEDEKAAAELLVEGVKSFLALSPSPEETLQMLKLEAQFQLARAKARERNKDLFSKMDMEMVRRLDFLVPGAALAVAKVLQNCPPEELEALLG